MVPSCELRNYLNLDLLTVREWIKLQDLFLNIKGHFTFDNQDLCVERSNNSNMVPKNKTG